MEREVIITGIGGQGIQLMAKLLAHAAHRAGKQVMLFGIYQGMMRGGTSASTVVISDTTIQAPPIVPHAWGVVAMHPMGLHDLAAKLRAGGVLFLNSTLVPDAPRDDVRVISMPATRLAEQAGNLMGAGMLALAAFCAATRLVEHDVLRTAMADALPAHRRQLADKNLALLNDGAAFARAGGLTAEEARGGSPR